jgi:hypothetical protein
VRGAHDGRLVDVGQRRVIVDEGSAAGEEAKILDALDGLADPGGIAQR